MDAALKQVLTRLLVATRGETEAMFQQIGRRLVEQSPAGAG
ncbi:hypothetical protein ACMFEQ_22120 [Klebsiella pneumoniae]